MLRLLVQWNAERLKMIFHDNASKDSIKLKKYYAKTERKTGIEIQSQHWAGNRKLSMGSIAVESFPNSVDLGSNEKSEFHLCISDYI